MYEIVELPNEGKIVITESFDVDLSRGMTSSTPYFDNIGDEYIISITNLQKVLTLDVFLYDTLGLHPDRYLIQYYRISINGTSWSNWLDLDANILNFPQIDPFDPLNIQIKWVRTGDSSIGTIRLLNYKIEGELERNEQILGTINLLPYEKKIIKVPFVYKVFSLYDIEILPNNLNIEILYRYSQDNTRTWSIWEPFTKANMTTLRINPIRFFQIEYSVENKSNILITVQDINIIGDIQNVSKDSQRGNLLGMRDCCTSNIVGYIDSDGVYHPDSKLNSNDETSISGSGSGSFNGDKCALGPNKPMSDSEKENLYDPYKQNAATKLLDKLSTDAEQVFGHEVTYFVTDPDSNGIDYTLNEFQLYNIVCKDNMKVSIEGNNFPDSQIKMNVFALDLFDTMEAHITKQQFKQIFGVQRRPSKEDFLYFCQVSRMYQVDHAQQFRGFNNTSVYYKLILKKYTQKANVLPEGIEVTNNLAKLINNTTIDQLFGIEIAQDKSAIANKPQTAPLSRDAIRLEYFAEIDKELIENSSNIISKSNYDLSSVSNGSVAVAYKNFDNTLRVSDNLSLTVWFSLNNNMRDETYNFMSFYDDVNNIGWKSSLLNDRIVVNLNSDVYNFDLLGIESIVDPIALEEETWYCYVLNIDQRQRNIEQFIYKRNVEYEEDAPNLNSTILKKVYNNKQDMSPISYIIQDMNINPRILGSDMKITNIRTFIDILPESSHNKLLNQYIIGDDSKYLIFADNATNRIHLNRYPLNE